MIVARYIVAFAAALAMLGPDVCMCGCPCERLQGGWEELADVGQPPVSSCCHPAPPTTGPIASAPCDCCCDARRPQAVEGTAPSFTSPDPGSPLFAITLAPPAGDRLEVRVWTGPDPPRWACSSPSLRSVLRN